MPIVVSRTVSSANEDVLRMLNVFYPVGSYYETSDTTFDPNISWGGTWVEDSAGRVTVALDSVTFGTVGDTGGAESHDHDVGGKSAVARIILKSNGRILTQEQATGAWTANYQESGMTASSISEGDQRYGALLAGNTGDGSTLQPYVVVKRWHRTA